VTVKLTLDTEGTREAGLDTHVCELQLVLLPMARLLVMCRPGAGLDLPADCINVIHGMILQLLRIRAVCVDVKKRFPYYCCSQVKSNER
jgi:hypothetical protein